MTLLSRLVAQLEYAGISKICIVSGHRADVLRDHLSAHPPRAEIDLAFNAHYETANNAFSLWAARDIVRDRPFLLCDGDVVLVDGVVERLMDAEKNALLVEARTDLGEEEMKVTLRDGRVSALSKTIAPSGAYGESIGVQKITSTAELWRTLKTMVEQNARGEYYEAAFQRMIDQGGRFDAVPVSSDEWIEIDDLADLERARARFGS
jgi:choline kinase